MLACSCSANHTTAHTADAAGNLQETSRTAHLQRIEVAGCIALPLLLPPHTVKQQAGHVCAVKAAAAVLLLLLGICVHAVCPLRRLLRARCLAAGSAILLPSLAAAAAAGAAGASILLSPVFRLQLAPARRQHCRQGWEAGATCSATRHLLHHRNAPPKLRCYADGSCSMRQTRHGAPLSQDRQHPPDRGSAAATRLPCSAQGRAEQTFAHADCLGHASRQKVCKATQDLPRARASTSAKCPDKKPAGQALKPAW